jgi:hypothetical protein
MLPLKSDAHPKGAYTEHELYKILAVSPSFPQLSPRLTHNLTFS